MVRSHRSAATFALLPVVLLAACSGAGSWMRKAREAGRRADFVTAFEYADAALKADPGSTEVQEFHRESRKLSLIQRGQALVFANRDGEAFLLFERALEIDPRSPIANEWLAKARGKLAKQALHDANEAMVAGRLEDALEGYKRALDYDPGNVEAREGADEVARTYAEGQDESHQHMIQGLHHQANGDYRVSAYHLRIAIARDPSNAIAAAELAEVARAIALEDYANAKAQERAGAFRAALVSYTRAAEVLEDDSDLAKRIEVCKRETEAAEFAAAAEKLLLRGEFARAREQLEKAASLTSLQSESIRGLLVATREREAEAQYTLGRDLQLQDRLDEALEAYRGVEAIVPGYSDALTVVRDLEQTVEQVRSSFRAGQEAEERGDLDEALAQYLEAKIAWPSYQDVARRVERIRALKAATSADGG